MFGFGFAPVGWLPCNGQTLSISQFTALFSLLGTTYGGNGSTTFNLPNLQSRVPVNQGQGAGLSTYVLGETTGNENVTLLSNQMPIHSHLVNANTAGSGNVASPSGAYPATATAEPRGTSAATYSTAAANATMNPAMIAPAGGSVPVPVIQPVLCVNFCIATQGIFPSRG
jgi:microcystin-dependent protein